MQHAISNFTSGHSPEFVLLALSICLSGAVTSVRVLQVALAATGRRSVGWLGAAALTTGCTIWSTHAIAMLAFDPGVPVAYDFSAALWSLGIGIATSAVAFAVMARRGGWMPFAAGSLFGWGVAAMHHVGMNGLVVPGHVSWDIEAVALSLAVGMLFGIPACLRSAACRPIADFCSAPWASRWRSCCRISRP